MDGVDKEKVQRVIYEMSKGSKYFENEQRKELLLKQKIERMQAQCAEFTSKDVAQFQTVCDFLRVTTHIILLRLKNLYFSKFLDCRQKNFGVGIFS